MRAGIFQGDCAGLRPDQRLDLLGRHIEGAGLDLVVCPELFACGYNVPQDWARLAEPRDGPFAQTVATLAERTGTAIAYGYAETADGRLFNSASCIGPGGALGHHRKLAIPPGVEAGHFDPGGGVSVFRLGKWTCAMLICYDVEFPETVREAALCGAELVLAPTALGAQWPDVAARVIPTRAFENGMWLAYSNHAGVENGLGYLGGSRIVAPNGSQRAVAGAAETLLTATLDRDAVSAARARLPYLADLAALRKRLNRPSG